MTISTQQQLNDMQDFTDEMILTIVNRYPDWKDQYLAVCMIAASFAKDAGLTKDEFMRNVGDLYSLSHTMGEGSA